MKKVTFAFTVAALVLWSGVASAHMFWVNLTDSRAHPPGHIMTSLGFGHTLPIDDFLVGPQGAIKIGKYRIIAPDMRTQDLGLPDATYHAPKESPLQCTVANGDLGLRKVMLAEGAQKGTYQVFAESIPMFFTQYIDTNGKQRMAAKPIDAIEDLSSVLVSFQHQSIAKALFAVGEWTEPRPVGTDLEITPLTDMSDIHVNDMVEFMVTFQGKPVNADSKNMRYLTCSGNTFGGPDGFHLGDMLMNGKAGFRIPAAGQWVANIFYSETVADNPALADLKDKCTMVYTAATVFFNVNP